LGGFAVGAQVSLLRHHHAEREIGEAQPEPGDGYRSQLWCCFCAGSWLHCNDEKMRVVSGDEVRRAQAYILVYVRSQAQLQAQPVTAAAAAADSSVKLPMCSLPRFSEMHKRSSEDGWMFLKRRKTTIW